MFGKIAKLLNRLSILDDGHMMKVDFYPRNPELAKTARFRGPLGPHALTIYSVLCTAIGLFGNWMYDASKSFDIPSRMTFMMISDSNLSLGILYELNNPLPFIVSLQMIK